MPFVQLRNTVEVFYQSALGLSATGDTGIIATPRVINGGLAIIPHYFMAIGTNMATDETNDVKIDWYVDAVGSGVALGTTTFSTQLTPGTPTSREIWPGDVTTMFSATDEWAPVPPFCKITWTLAGTTKSMDFTIWWSYMTLGL